MYIYIYMASFVSVFIQFVCEFMLILVHLFHWFEPCWCKVHSRRICLSLSIGFQSLFEICSSSPKKHTSFWRRSRTLSMRLEGSTQEIAIMGFQQKGDLTRFRQCNNNNNNNISIVLMEEDISRMLETLKSITSCMSPCRRFVC